MQLFRLAVVVGVAICTASTPVFAQGRVVSIGGDVTEIVYALGKGDVVVATDSTSVFPAPARATEKVGYVRQLSAEGVLSVEPDLILISGAAGPPAAVEQLRAAGVAMVEMPTLYTLDSIYEKVETIAAALNVKDEGSALKARMAQEWQVAQSAVASLPDGMTALFFTTLRDGAPRAAGTKTAAHGLIDMLGAKNVFDSRIGYKGLSLEAAVAADPDIILVMDRYADRIGGLEAVKAHPAISLTTAAQEGRIVLVDAVQAMQFSPRTPAAVGRLAQIISENLPIQKTAKVAN